MDASVNCYMTEGTRNALGVSGHRVRLIKALEKIQIGTFDVLPFSISHDAAEPVGFLLKSKASGEKLLFITDSFYCKYFFRGVNYFMLECNYSMLLLEENIKSGKVPAFIKNRVMRSHFEIENVKEFFRANDLSRCRAIHLLHISKTNGNPKQFKKQIEQLTGVPAYV